jgi:hypothetical protein
MSLRDFFDPRKRLERSLAREVAKAKNRVLNWIAPDRFAETGNYYTVSGRVTRSLLIYDKPGKAKAGWDGWLASLLLCDGGPETPGSVRLNITWQAFTPFGAGIKLGLAETGHEASLELHAKRGTIPGRDLRNAVRDVGRVQQALSDAETRLLAVCVLVTCESDTKEGCDAVWRQVTSKLGGRLLHYRPLDDRHALAFGQQSLGGLRPIWHPLSWDTATLAFSWPCIGDSVDMGVGPIWGTNTATSLPVQYDPFAIGGPPAPHVCIIGPTGNGKSVAFFTVVSEYLTEPHPPRVRIIDPKGDYLVASERLGGTVVAFNQQPVVTINCFDLAPVEWAETDQGPQPVVNVVYEGVQNVLGTVRLMVAASGAAFDPAMGSILQTAVLRAYARSGIDPEAPDTWDTPSGALPTLEALWECLTEMSREEELPAVAGLLAVLIKPYAKGMWARLFARHTTANFNNPFIVYDVRGLTPELRPVAIHVIAALTWREARRNPGRTIFGMDEVTQLMRYPESGRLVADVYLQGRSAGLAAWSMAQRTEHYTATQEGRDALAMAHTVLLLKQSGKDAVAEAVERFKITPGQRAKLETAAIGQGLLCTERGNVFLNIDPPPVVLEWLPKPVKKPDDVAEVTGLTV